MQQDGQDAQRIAIVGMVGRFPEAASVNELWRMLDAGKSATRWPSDEELLDAGVTRAELRDPNYVKATLRLPDMDKFDPGFFGIGRQDAAVLDPQHRHFLECCWEALEDAGRMPESFEGSIGVFGGCGMQAYMAFNLLANPELVQRMGLFLMRHTGNDKDFLATRVSYALNLTGPSISVQTACSTSLVAIHTACQSLLAGECDLALAGGASIEVPHGRGYRYAEGEILSSDGHCRAFSDDADGTLFGSGVGVLALRRYEDAVADGDNIQAVVLATAVNNDGSGKASYLAPSVDGQAEAAAEALALSGVGADDVDYIEAHGTGTPIGDPIELEALAQAYDAGRERRIRIGSVKSNIGHLDTAAGVASVIKVVQAMKHERLPQTLHVTKPNSRFDFAGSPFEIAGEPMPWERCDRPRRAAVNSLGVGGTNAHAVIEEAPKPASHADDKANELPQLFLLSARTETSLRALRGKWQAALAEGEIDSGLADAAFTTHVGRRHFQHRLAVPARNFEELAAALGDERHCLPGTGTAETEDGSPVTFMFPGGGTQYPRAAADLYERCEVFRAAIEECFDALPDSAPDDLRQLMFGMAENDDVAAAELAKPQHSILAVFIVEYALAQMWQAWGVLPSTVIGHSAGEYAAAVSAGVMSLRDALGVVSLRGEIFEAMPKGGMLAVTAAEGDVKTLIDELPLDIAAVNAPDVTVVSGAARDIEMLRARLADAGLDASRVRIAVAAHSRMLDPFLQRFREHVGALRLAEPKVPFVSNLTGAVAQPGELTDPEYWVRHLRETVRFGDGMACLASEPGRLLLEVGPGQTLSNLAEACAGARAFRASVRSTRAAGEEGDDLLVAYAAAGKLWAAGGEVDLASMRGDGARRRVSLPTYAFDHERYWIEAGARPAAPTEGQPADERRPPIERLASLDDWLSTTEWQRADRPAAGRSAAAQWLLLDDGSTLADALADGIAARGGDVVRVERGSRYSRIDRNRHVVRPSSVGDMTQLFERLADDGQVPSFVISLWSAETSTDQATELVRAAFDEPLAFAKALQSAAIDDEMRFVGITSPQVSTDTVQSGVAGATLAGFARVLQREVPSIEACAFDLDREARPTSQLAAEVIAEALLKSRDVHVLLRGSDRLVQRHRALPTSLDQGKQAAISRLKPRGVYLITGSGGGIAGLLAGYLAGNFSARLVLLSRREPTAIEQRTITELESLGAEVLLVTADVTDAGQMRDAIDQARACFGTLDGVFHTAGKLDDELVALRSVEAAHAVISPKLNGALILDTLLSDGTLDIFAVFSSTSALLGAEGQADYAAANAGVQALAEARSDGLCISWGIWSDVGMAARRYGCVAKGDLEAQTHPLLGGRVGSSDATVRFIASISAGQHWPLSDHVINGREILPGTAYIDMAYAAMSSMNIVGPVRIETANFLRPFQVDPSQPVELRTVVCPRDDGSYGLSIDSRGKSGEWVQHFVAYARKGANDGIGGERRRSRASAASRAIRESDLLLQGDRIAFGSRWQVIESAQCDDATVFAQLCLPDDFTADLETYAFHPGLLDMAVTIGLHVVPEPRAEGALFAPVSVDQVELIAPLTQRLTAKATLREPDRDLPVFDVELCDPSGRPLVLVHGLAMRRLTGDQLAENDAQNASVGDNRPMVERLLAAGIRASDADAILGRVFARPDRHVVASSIALDVLTDHLRRPRHVEKPTAAAARDAGNAPVHSNPVQAEIAAILGDLLGTDNISGEDRIQDLGAHSLMVVRLVARIRKQFGVQLSLATLWQNPSLAELATIVARDAGLQTDAIEATDEKIEDEKPDAAEAQAEASWSPLVKIAPDRPGRLPLFCIHGADGNVVAFKPLVDRLAETNPIYGLEARGADGILPTHETIEEMATSYIDAILSVEPNGPYCLLGYSGGGVIGFEIAQQLEKAGKRVAMLAMVDSLAPDHAPTAFERARHYLNDISLKRIRNSLSHRIGRLQARFDTFSSSDCMRSKSYRCENDANADRCFQAYLRAQQRYMPQPYEGDLLLYRATEADIQFASAGKHLGWDRHLKGRIELEEIEANHFEILHPPAIDAIADLVGQRMDRASCDAMQMTGAEGELPGSSEPSSVSKGCASISSPRRAVQHADAVLQGHSAR